MSSYEDPTSLFSAEATGSKTRQYDPEAKNELSSDARHEVFDDRHVTASDIRAAYRLLLNREVDPEGLLHYSDMAAAGALSLGELAQSLTDSDENLARRAERIVAIDMGGFQVVIDPDEPEFGRAIARDKVWEAHVAKQIEAQLKPGGVFIDVGGNVGVMSFHAARAVGPNGRVIAFEPNPDNVQRFLRGVVLNGLTNVSLYPVALSATSDVFSIRGSSNTHLTHANLGGRLVQSFPGDALLHSETRVDLIKLDIEGHEPRALDGLERTLARHKPLLICEFNPRCLLETATADAIDFARQLFGVGERVEVVEHDGSLLPISDATALMQLWRQRNEQHVARGDLPDGMVHFDLLIHPD